MFVRERETEKRKRERETRYKCVPTGDRAVTGRRTSNQSRNESRATPSPPSTLYIHKRANKNPSTRDEPKVLSNEKKRKKKEKEQKLYDRANTKVGFKNVSHISTLLYDLYRFVIIISFEFYICICMYLYMYIFK